MSISDHILQSIGAFTFNLAYSKRSQDVVLSSTETKRPSGASILPKQDSDHKKIFWDVCIKAPGGTDDATHFRDSLLYHRLTSGDVVWDKFISVRGHHVRPYVVGDRCFPLLPFLLTAFSPNGMGTLGQKLFDGMLVKGSSVVVETIALLKKRWKILQDLNTGVHHAPKPLSPVTCCTTFVRLQGIQNPSCGRSPTRVDPNPRSWTMRNSFVTIGVT